MSQPAAGAGGEATPEKTLQDVASDVTKNSNSSIDNASTENGGSVEEIGEKDKQTITNLARQLSQISRRSSYHPAGDDLPNPFLDPDADPELNPHSEQFSYKKWIKHILHIRSRDPERYPKRSAGVSFRNLNAYGFGTAADYQADVFNIWLKGFGWIKNQLGFGKKVRIDILRDFEGLVRSGEMLVVLGRPGR